MKGLRNIRKERGLSLADLEKLTGLAAITFSSYERGIVSPSVKTAAKIANALGVTIEELITPPKHNRIRITLSYDWEKYEKGEIDMTGNAFDVNLGRTGVVGLKGAGDFTSLEAIDKFLEDVREQLVTAFEAQVKRGAVQPA